MATETQGALVEAEAACYSSVADTLTKAAGEVEAKAAKVPALGPESESHPRAKAAAPLEAPSLAAAANEVAAWLQSVCMISPSDAVRYAEALAEDGFDNMQASWVVTCPRDF